MIPHDPQLRESLIWLACRAEGDGPAGFGIDPSTPSGSAAWTNLARAISWIYENAIDPDSDPRQLRMFTDAAAADR